MTKTTQEISELKSHMRRSIRASRRSTPVTERAHRDAQIQRHLSEYLSSLSVSTITAYVPMPHEPGGRSLPDALTASGLQVFLPRIIPIPDANKHGVSGTLAETLEWVHYKGDMTRTARGIEEPTGDAVAGVVPPVDFFVVPALAIDRNGRRLGQGGGFYDRALAQLGTNDEICAIVDHGEFLTTVPTDTWDLRVNSVVTDRGLTKIDAENQ